MLYQIAQTCSSGCGPPINMFPILIVVVLMVGYSYVAEKIKGTGKGKETMKKIKNISGIVIVAVVLVVAAAAIVLARQAAQTQDRAPGASVAGAAAGGASAHGQALPRLIDLGASKCMPCKMMKPILDDLKTSYADVFTTQFIDVWENSDIGHQYGIESIPTQIFFDAEGRELHRHVGFMSKADILGRWKELGIEVAPSAPAAEPFSR